MITVKKSEYNKAKLRKLFKEASQQYIQITDEEAVELGLTESNPINITLSKTDIIAPYQGNTYNITVTTTGKEWGITPIDDFFTVVTQNTNQQNGTITITISNNSLRENRTGYITVISGTARATIKITQEYEYEGQYYTNMYNNIEYEIYEDENNDIILNISNFDENNLYDNNISKCCLYIGILDNNDNIISGYSDYIYDDLLLQEIKNGKNIIQPYIIQYSQQNLLSYNPEYYVNLLLKVYYKNYSCNYYGKNHEKRIMFTLNNDKSFYYPHITQYPQINNYIDNYSISNQILVKPLIFNLKNNEYNLNNYNIITKKEVKDITYNTNENGILEFNCEYKYTDYIEFKLNDYIILHRLNYKYNDPSNYYIDINNINIINTYNYNINLEFHTFSTGNNQEYYINNEDFINIIAQSLNCQKEALRIYTNYEGRWPQYSNSYENNYVTPNIRRAQPPLNELDYNENVFNNYYNINMIAFENGESYYPYNGLTIFETSWDGLSIFDRKIKLFFTVNNNDFICVNCGFNTYDIIGNLLWTIDPITGEKQNYNYNNYRCNFIFDTSLHPSPCYLTDVINNTNHFYKVETYLENDQRHIKTTNISNGDIEDILLTTNRENQQTCILGANNCIIIGTNSEGTLVAYDGQCYNCIDENNIDYPLTFNNGKLYCDNCKRSYNTNNGKIIEGSNGIDLCKYNISFSDNILRVWN